MNDRRKPMDGLAQWLRTHAIRGYTDYPEKFSRWADEVEASAAPLAVGGVPDLLREAASELEIAQDTISEYQQDRDEPPCTRYVDIITKLRAAILSLAATPVQAPQADKGLTDTSHLDCWESREQGNCTPICEPCNTGNRDGCLYKKRVPSPKAEAPTDTEMLDWLETAYTSGGFKPKPWRDFMTQVAHLGYRAAISEAMKDPK